MARMKKSRSMRGKLAKTGTKEMMKEQNKARKASSPRRFEAKKAKQRKEQAHKKLERLGLLPEPEVEEIMPRPRRFVYVKPEEQNQKQAKKQTPEINKESEELSLDELLDAFTEKDQA